MRPIRSQRGFTLLEVLVALSVFALAAVAVLNVTGEGTRTLAVREAASLARVVAHNRLAEASLSPGPLTVGDTTGVEVQRGRSFAWVLRVSPTDQPGLWRHHVQVRESTRSGPGSQVLAELTTFLAVDA
jgi:general secretion pathway protein I